MSSSNVSLRMEKTRSGGMELGALARTKVKRYKGATVERPPDSKGRDARGNASALALGPEATVDPAYHP